MTKRKLMILFIVFFFLISICVYLYQNNLDTQGLKKTVVSSNMVTENLEDTSSKSWTDNSSVNQSSTGGSASYQESKVDTTPDINRTPVEPSIANESMFSIKSQKELDQLILAKNFDLSGLLLFLDNSEAIVFPKGTYIVKKQLMLASRGEGKGSINFNGSDLYIGEQGNVFLRFYGDGFGRTIGNLTVYGSTTEKYKLGKFVVQGFRGSNFNFENMTFVNAQSTNNHIFDLANCKNIVINKINCLGYGDKDYSDKEITTIFKKNPHNVFSEAIQLDIDTEGCFGKEPPSHMQVFKEMPIGELKKMPCENISIYNSTFSSLEQSRTGESLINGETNQVESRRFAPTGIGSHTGKNMKQIVVSNCLFQDTIRVKGIDDDKRLYPIHFKDTDPKQIGLDRNQFDNTFGKDTLNGHVKTYVGWFK